MSIIPSNSKVFYIVLNQHRHLSNTAVEDTSWYKVVLILRIISKNPFKMTFYTIRYFKSESPGEPWVRILLPLNNFFLFFVFIFFLSIASLQIIFEFDYIFEPICSHFYIKRLSK